MPRTTRIADLLRLSARGHLLAVMLTFAVALAVVLATTAPASTGVLPRASVAVLPFHVDGTAFSAGQGQVMGELLTAELLATGRYIVVERIQLDKAADELALQMSWQIDPSIAVALGRRAGAQVIMIGTLAGGEREKLVLGRFVDVGTGSVMVARNLSVAAGSLLPAARSLEESLVAKEEELAKDLFARAQRQDRLGLTESALDTFEEVATRYSHTSVGKDAVLRLARFYLAEGEYFNAADHAERLLSTFPDDPQAEEALFLLAESKDFTVFGNPDRVGAPRVLLEEWRKREVGRDRDSLDSIRLRASVNQDAKLKYELLLENFPRTKHAPVALQHLDVINRHGGR